MALLRLIWCPSSRILSRSIRMSANVQEKAAAAVDKLKADNPYFEKYAQKIAKVEKTTPEQLLARLEKRKLEQAKEQAKELAMKGPEAKVEKRDYSELMRPKKANEVGKGEIPYKKLSDLLKLDLVDGMSVEEITKLWLEYHKQKEVIAAVIPTAIFNKLMDNAKKYPLFLVPIPRSQGFEFIVFQFAANTVHFTPLLCYQVHKENAPECLNIVHYTEFQDQGIVLMRGEFDSKVLTPQEAQCLANQLQLYYTQDNPKKVEILETFTKAPDKFKHQDIITELENLQIT